MNRKRWNIVLSLISSLLALAGGALILAAILGGENSNLCLALGLFCALTGSFANLIRKQLNRRE